MQSCSICHMPHHLCSGCGTCEWCGWNVEQGRTIGTTDCCDVMIAAWDYKLQQNP